MKRTILAVGLLAAMTTQAHAWGLGEIGGKLLQKGVEGAVNSAVNGNSSKDIQQQTTEGVKQEAANQAQQGADTLNAQVAQPDPNTLEGAATNIAADAASQAATNALSNSGIPGANIAGSVAGSLVKGFGGMFKRKPAEAQPAETTTQPQQ